MYLLPYKKEWKQEFIKERLALLENSDSYLTVHHIGSTAIEGLYAKDCIDILGVVEHLSDVNRFSANLEKIGYINKGAYGIENRAYFSKSKRKVHLHIFQKGDENIEKHLNFVRIMQENTVLISELNMLKQSLHEKYPLDKDRYQQEKAFFYQQLS